MPRAGPFGGSVLPGASRHGRHKFPAGGFAPRTPQGFPEAWNTPKMCRERPGAAVSLAGCPPAEPASVSGGPLMVAHWRMPAPGGPRFQPGAAHARPAAAHAAPCAAPTDRWGATRPFRLRSTAKTHACRPSSHVELRIACSACSVMQTANTEGTSWHSPRRRLPAVPGASDCLRYRAGVGSPHGSCRRHPLEPAILSRCRRRWEDTAERACPTEPSPPSTLLQSGRSASKRRPEVHLNFVDPWSKQVGPPQYS